MTKQSSQFCSLGMCEEVELGKEILARMFKAKRSPDFTILHCGHKYRVFSKIAAIESVRIRLLLEEDPLTNSMTLNLPDIPIESVIELLNGGPGNFDETMQFAVYAAVELRMDKFITKNKASIAKILTTESALKLLVMAFKYGSEYDIFVDYLARRCEEIEDQLSQLPVELIDVIMKSPYYNGTEEFTIKFVLKMVDINRYPNHRLTKYLPTSMLEHIPGFDASQKRRTISLSAPIRQLCTTSDDADDVMDTDATTDTDEEEFATSVFHTLNRY